MASRGLSKDPDNSPESSSVPAFMSHEGQDVDRLKLECGVLVGVVVSGLVGKPLPAICWLFEALADSEDNLEGLNEAGLDLMHPLSVSIALLVKLKNLLKDEQLHLQVRLLSEEVLDQGFEAIEFFLEDMIDVEPDQGQVRRWAPVKEPQPLFARLVLQL